MDQATLIPRGARAGALAGLAILASACGDQGRSSGSADPGAGAAIAATQGADGGAALGAEQGTSQPTATPSAPTCSRFETVAEFAVTWRETSGLARSARSDSILWTHNDSGGEASLAALDLAGRTLGVVGIPGARNRDWEALSAGPCAEGSCLFIGDIGDNLNERDPVTIYRVTEPPVDASRSARARAWSLTYPGGPRDAEGLAVHPATGEVWIVSKGRAHAIEVFRVPLGDESAEVVADPVIALTNRPVTPGRMITGATFSPDGRWLLVRSYTELFFLPVDDAGVPGPPARPTVDLAPLGERQGEAVEAFADGWVYFTSEARLSGAAPVLSRASCSF
ncbi:MAG: hypothetical protein ABFS34_09635 [Gemmatimonadota bacterium]